MPDDDDLRRLRAADPIGHDSLPTAQDPMAREMFERITMRKPTTLTRRPLLLAAAAVIAVVGAGAAIAARGGDSADRSASGTTTTRAAVTPGGPGVIGNCVETYSLDTLKNREAAFDGTVRGVAGDTISFSVNRWYRGGRGTTATRQGATTLGGMNSAGAGASLEPGTRLLVAGDGGFAWSCGFTRPYDAATASDWAAALG